MGCVCRTPGIDTSHKHRGKELTDPVALERRGNVKFSIPHCSYGFGLHVVLCSNTIVLSFQERCVYVQSLPLQLRLFFEN